MLKRYIIVADTFCLIPDSCEIQHCWRRVVRGGGQQFDFQIFKNSSLQDGVTSKLCPVSICVCKL